jgi:alkylated DNA repair dioxygenase AlkB
MKSPFDSITEQTRSITYRVDGIDVEYDPDFLDQARAMDLFHALLVNLPWESHVIGTPGGPRPVPRRTSWHADPHFTYRYGGIRHCWKAWTPELSFVRELAEEYAGCQVNSVLVNLYDNERSSVAPHADDEPDMVSDAPILSVSLGATRDFVLKHGSTGAKIILPLEHGSILVMSGSTQRVSRHGVPKSKHPRGPRINLTFRTARR